MERFQVIDADGHVEESAASLQKYLKKENRGRPLWTSDSWDRDFGKTLGKNNEDPHTQLVDMDADGIDVQVIYPTRGISLSAAREVDLAVDIARAYNDWLAEFCSTNPERLKGVALVALQDVGAAVKEARRAVEELGFVGVMMPTNVLDQDIGLRQFWPFYEEVERLNVGLAFHGGIRASQRMHGRFGNFIAVHTVAFPLECMIALTVTYTAARRSNSRSCASPPWKLAVVGSLSLWTGWTKSSKYAAREKRLFSKQNRASTWLAGSSIALSNWRKRPCPTLLSGSDRTSCFTLPIIRIGTLRGRIRFAP